MAFQKPRSSSRFKVQNSGYSKYVLLLSNPSSNRAQNRAIYSRQDNEVFMSVPCNPKNKSNNQLLKVSVVILALLFFRMDQVHCG